MFAITDENLSMDCGLKRVLSPIGTQLSVEKPFITVVDPALSEKRPFIHETTSVKLLKNKWIFVRDALTGLPVHVEKQ